MIGLAKQWIDECVDSHEKCRAQQVGEWHPSRLLDLRSFLDPEMTNEHVRLVSCKAGEKFTGQDLPTGHYMTLSHRWGQQPFLKLTRSLLGTLLDGISITRLPETFRNAIKVACDLHIRWLWIDALCIIQDDAGMADWLEESSQMEKVYANSYCNISATASWDSSEGLYKTRNPDLRWVENVTLNTKDVDGRSLGTITCSILDLDFWSKHVDSAPVNRRSWVYQERMLSPRILHWCHDQIAFECKQSSRAESWPGELPRYRRKADLLIDDVHFKGVDVEAATQLRALRNRGKLRRTTEPTNPALEPYTLWRHWVEIYSKMELTNQSDRLIALAGIAKLMSSILASRGISDQYIAGMWQKQMASQLLWHVNEGAGAQRQPNENTRPGGGDPVAYRAPTFSWASVETPRGITFPETTDEGLLVHVEVVRLRYLTLKDKFGLLRDGYIVLRGMLRKIELTDHNVQSPSAGTANDGISSPPPSTSSADRAFDPIHQNRYTWRLVLASQPVGDTYSQIWLDSPASLPTIFGPSAQIYVMPVQRDVHHLKCLVLQAQDGEYGMRYQRVGMARVSVITDDLIKGLTTPPGQNVEGFGEYYWGEGRRLGGESTICIV